MNEGYKADDGDEIDPIYRDKYRIEVGSEKYALLYAEGKNRKRDVVDSVLASMVSFFADPKGMEAELKKVDPTLLEEVKERIKDSWPIEGYSDSDVVMQSRRGDDHEDTHRELLKELEETLRIKGMLGLPEDVNISDFFADILFCIKNIQQDLPEDEAISRPDMPEFLFSQRENIRPLLSGLLVSGKVPDLSGLSDDDLSSFNFVAQMIGAALRSDVSVPQWVKDTFSLDSDGEIYLKRIEDLRLAISDERVLRATKTFDDLIARPSDKIDILLESIFNDVNLARIVIEGQDEETRKELNARFNMIHRNMYVFGFGSSEKNAVQYKKFKEYYFKGTDAEFLSMMGMIGKVLKDIIKG